MPKIKNQLSFVAISLFCTSVFAANYPSQYQISNAGFNNTSSLQEKLNTTQGEVYFKNTGLYLGASDVFYKERIESDNFYEVDTYAGIKKNAGVFGYHVGLKSYNRSINKNLIVQEYYVGINISDLSFSYASNEQGDYRQLNLTRDISSINWGLHLGQTSLLQGEEFLDWSVYATRTYKNLMFNAIMTKNENPINNGAEFNLGVERNFSLF